MNVIILSEIVKLAVSKDTVKTRYLIFPWSNAIGRKEILTNLTFTGHIEPQRVKHSMKEIVLIRATIEWKMWRALINHITMGHS